MSIRECAHMKIIARDRKGVEHVLEGNEGWTVMEALRDAGLPITAEEFDRLVRPEDMIAPK